MVATGIRMLRLGVVADRRWGSAALAAVPKLVRGARLDSIWYSSRPPTGPLPQIIAEQLTAVATDLSVAIHDERDVVVWSERMPSRGVDERQQVLVPASANRSLLHVLSLWQTRGGSLERLVVELPVSIGRTRAEAEARATAWFDDVGAPQEHGLFGTLEDCQEQAGALAALGLTELCCVLPAGDLPDVIAQISSVGIGTVAMHGPGADRSPSPPPPAGWGGPGRTAT